MLEQQGTIQQRSVYSAETLSQMLLDIRQTLEKHLEAPVGNQPLIFCQQQLHQVRDALKQYQQVSLSLLSNELASLVSALCAQEITNAQLALETLLQGVLQLSLCTERALSRQHAPNPIELITTLNALRRVRHQPPIIGMDCFLPAAQPPMKPVATQQLAHLVQSGVVTRLRKIRQTYQACLTHYLRNVQPDQYLARMVTLCGAVHNVCWGAPLSSLWDVSAAFITGLSEQAIQRTADTDQLLKALDQQLKQLLDSDFAYLNQSPDALVKQLLYLLAQVDSQHQLITIQKQRYQLDQAFPAELLARACDAASERRHQEAPKNSHKKQRQFTIRRAANTPPAKRQDTRPRSAANTASHHSSNGTQMDQFIAAATAIQQELVTLLPQWQACPSDVVVAKTLQHCLQILKQDSRQAGAYVIGELASALENMLSRVTSGVIKPNAYLFSLMANVGDMLPALLQDVVTDSQLLTPEVLVFMEQADDLARGESFYDDAELRDMEVAKTRPVGSTVSAGRDKKQDEKSKDKPGQCDEVQQPSDQASIPQPAHTTAKIPPALLEPLAAYADALDFQQTLIERQVADHVQILQAMSCTITRLQTAIEPSITTQSCLPFKEAVVELVNEHQTMQANSQSLQNQLRQQAHSQQQLQTSLLQARVTSFELLLSTLRDTAQCYAAEQGKAIDWHSHCAAVQVNHGVLDTLHLVLEPLLKHAIAHGIEGSPDARVKAGKPEAGQMHLTLCCQGAYVVAELHDDGHGIDKQAARAWAVAEQHITAETTVDNTALAQWLLMPGFAAAVSGHSLGLDTMNTCIQQQGGHIAVNNRPGHGFSFIVRLPFALSVSQALIVRLGDSRYAIPLYALQGVARLDADTLTAAYQQQTPISQEGSEYTVVLLSQRLGDRSACIAPGGACSILLLQTEHGNWALYVDAVHGTREIITQSLSAPFAKLKGVQGATVLADNQLALVLDPIALITSQ